MEHPMSRLRRDNLFLFKRDACSDTFGSDWSSNICSPSETLCCYQSGQTFPSCEVHLDKGWCCVGNSSEDNCYVDQPSACATPNSVPCTNLAEGVTEACCPPLTSCSDDYNATQDAIRCNIRYESLILLDVQSTTTSIPVATSTSTSTTSIVTSLTKDPGETTSSAGDPQAQSSQGLSGGGIAGTVVGTVAGVAIAGAVAYYFLRRRWIAKYANRDDPSRHLDKAPVATHVVNAPMMYPWQHTLPQELAPENAPTRYELSANR